MELTDITGIIQVTVGPRLISKEKLAHELVKMPPAIKNFTGHLYFSSEEHLPAYVAYNHRYRAPLDGMIFNAESLPLLRCKGDHIK